MKHVSRRAGAAAVLLGFMAVSGGCTDEQTGFFIQGNVRIESPECLARADSGSTLLLDGLLDVGLRTQYEATLLVGNQLAPRGDKTSLRTETMIATVTGAEVQLFTDTGELDTEFTVPTSGVIMPDGGDDAGLAVLSATLIPAASGQALADELTSRNERRTRVARVTVFGETLGGLEVESSPFSYVILVCEGCLVDFPAGSLDPVEGCVGDGEDVVPPCRPGQDDPVSCQYCSGGNPFCTWPGGVGP